MAPKKSKTKTTPGQPPTTRSKSLDPAVAGNQSATPHTNAPDVTKIQPSSNHHEHMKDLFKMLDSETSSLQPTSGIPALLSELKTTILGSLFQTVSRLESKLPAQPPRTYASVLGASTTEKPTPIRDLREIPIQRRDLDPEEATATPNEITSSINKRLSELKLGQIITTRKLKSGDLVLLADSEETKIRALQKQHEWIQVIGKKAHLRPKKYTVLVHGVPVAAFDNTKQEEGIQYIHEQNKLPVARGARVTRLHWRQLTLMLHKSYSSLLLDIESPGGANVLLREGLVIDSELKEVELFDPSCMITRCY